MQPFLSLQGAKKNGPPKIKRLVGEESFYACICVFQSRALSERRLDGVGADRAADGDWWDVKGATTMQECVCICLSAVGVDIIVFSFLIAVIYQWTLTDGLAPEDDGLRALPALIVTMGRNGRFVRGIIHVRLLRQLFLLPMPFSTCLYSRRA